MPVIPGVDSAQMFRAFRLWRTRHRATVCKSLLLAACLLVVFEGWARLEPDVREVTCNHVTRPESGHVRRLSQVWQLHHEENTSFIVYSAFYDDRPMAGDSAYVRVMALTVNLWRHASRPRLWMLLGYQEPGYCQVWYDGVEQPTITPVIKVRNGAGDDWNGTFYEQVLLSCQLPDRLTKPTHISLVTHPCTTSTIYLPIHISQPHTEYKHEFAVCVDVSHDSWPTNRFIEWVEYNRLFGVGHIHIYNGTMTPQLLPVTQHYEKEGLLTVHHMPPPANVGGKKGAKLGSPASLNDCMMRYMYDYKYIIVIDVDEVIVPHCADNYRDMLRIIDDHNPEQRDWLSYTFRNTIFFHDMGPDIQQPPELHTLRYRMHIDPGGPFWAPKSFIDPRRCLSVFNHFCLVRFDGSPRSFTVDVDPLFGKSNHYKTCGWSDRECSVMMRQNTEDNELMKYKDIMLARIAQVKKKLPSQQNC